MTKQTKVLFALAAAYLVLRPRSVVVPIAPPAGARRNLDPTNWGLDLWARLSGIDLSLDGQNPAPAGLDAYGMANEMTWQSRPDRIENVLF